jgi:hypothetical protein
MTDLVVQIFTFNSTESAAVDSLLEILERATGARPADGVQTRLI